MEVNQDKKKLSAVGVKDRKQLRSNCRLVETVLVSYHLGKYLYSLCTECTALLPS